MKVFFETFGCRLNRAEALEDEARYLAAGCERADSHAAADLIIVRGCSVTARAAQDCERLIKHLRRKYPGKSLLVKGCLEEAVKDSATDFFALPTSTARAYLKVQDGCSGKCSFCIVPRFRGKARSENFNELLDRGKRFIDSGYHEIVVTGCNLALYASEGKYLDDLIAALSDLSPDCRVRLGSVEPGSAAKRVVEVMAERKNLCRFLHVPVQSASARILAAMRRPYSVREVEELLVLAARRMPTLSLGCDLMTGFPGETPADFEATKNLLLRHRFALAHIFPYSERPGTDASTMAGAVAKMVRKERAKELAALAVKLREERARSFVGRQVEIVVERDDCLSGWTDGYFRFHGKKTDRSRRKELVSVPVSSVRGDTLFM